MLDLAFPATAWWPAALIAVALFAVVTTGSSVRTNLAAAFAFGTTFSLSNLSWATSWAPAAGPGPWTALSVLMGGWYALAAALGSWLPRLMPRRWRTPATASVIAAAWVLREWAMARFPLGGFGWSELAVAMIDTDLAALYPWIGSAATTLLSVFVTTWIVLSARQSQWPARMPLAPLAAGLAFAVAATVTPTWSALSDERQQIQVVAVQGNTMSGYFDPPVPPGAILAQQLRESMAVPRENVDLLVWPEGASDLDPLREPAAARAFDAASAWARAPLLGWAITMGSDPENGRPVDHNTALLWTVNEGDVARYDKRRPVPFGEYLPFRDAFEVIAPSIAALIGRDYAPGTSDPVVAVAGAEPFLAGVAICFDLVDDDLFWQMSNDGAEVILIPSNNADFRGTDQSEQQLAVARVRAAELGRSVLNASTVGVTASIGPDGSVIDRLEEYRPGALTTSLPLISTETPAATTRGNVGIAVALSMLGIPVAFRLSRRDRLRSGADVTRAAGD